MEMSGLHRFGALILMAASAAGCASIVSGDSQVLSFSSNPDGAQVMINGRFIGITPVTASLERKSGQILTFSEDGYKTLSMKLETHVNGWFWGNLLFGGLLGSSTDASTGAFYKYSPGQYLVTLQPESTTPGELITPLDGRQKAKEFIIIAYRNIQTDLSAGEGQYLTSLFELLKVPPESRPDALKKIRALSEAYRNIAQFADTLTDVYLANNHAAP